MRKGLEPGAVAEEFVRIDFPSFIGRIREKSK